MLSLLIWNGKGRSYFAKYLCSVTLNTLLERFFAKKNQNLTPVIFPCGRHGCASQHHTMRHEDRERYTLQCLTAPHHETLGQRKVHIAVSHRTTPRDTGTERCTHYSVSQHRTMRHEERERYTWLCLTAPHRMSWRQREVHMTVSDGTTLYDRRKDKNTQ